MFAYWALDNPASSRAQITWADYLADIGAPEVGLERLMIAHEYYPDEASLLLHTWTLSCRHDLPPPFSIQQIATTDGLDNHREDVNYQLRELLEGLQENRCAYPPLEELVGLFERVGSLSLSARASSAYHVLFSELYVAMGQLDPALIQLSRSFQKFPNPEVIIRQAILAASAGNYADSLVFLGRAREAELEQQFFKQSNSVEIDRLENEFRRLLEAQ